MSSLELFAISFVGGAFGALGIVSYIFWKLEYLGSKIRKLEKDVENLEFQVRVLQAQFYLPDYKNE